MFTTVTSLAIGLLAAVALADADCAFTPQCDYGHGSRASALAATQEACCAACTDRPGCAAGVFDGKSCWFKTAAQVKGGCTKRASVVAACIPPSVKPGPAPGPAPGPPGPKPKPSPPGPKPPPPPPAPLPVVPPSKDLDAVPPLARATLARSRPVGGVL